MDNDSLDFLDGAPAEAITAPEAQQPAAEATSEGPIRGPDGKFLPKAEAQPAPAGEVQAPEPAPVIETPAPVLDPTKPPEGYVPVAALQELRKELQALKAPSASPIDPHEDPDGAIYQANFNWSQRLAVAQHGEAAVTEALEWAKARADRDPAFNQAAFANPDPIGFAIAEHQRDKALALLSDPKLLSTFQAFMAGQQAAPAPQPAPVQISAPPPPPTPPRSQASAPAAGGAQPGAQPVGPKVAFENAFKD